MTQNDKHIDPEALERYESAMVDADIEGLPRDSEAEALVEKWRAEGISTETQIALLKDLYQGRQLRAAE